jgi:hypothetical protein
MGKMKEIWAETQHDDGQWDVYACEQQQERTPENKVIDSIYITVCDAMQVTTDPQVKDIYKKVYDLCTSYYNWEISRDDGNWQRVIEDAAEAERNLPLDL